MNKKDLSLVVVLILLMFAWMVFDRTVLAPRFTPEPTGLESVEEGGGEDPNPADGVVESSAEGEALPQSTPVPLVTGVESVIQMPEVGSEDQQEERMTLKNDVLTLEFSNRGAGVESVVFSDQYPATLQDKEIIQDEEQQGGETVELFFDHREYSALHYNLAGLTPHVFFQVEQNENQLVFTREVGPGLFFRREVTLEEGYELKVLDQWTNTTDEALSLPGMELYLGTMIPVENISQKFGPFIGIDAMHPGREGIQHYVKKLKGEVGDVDGEYREEINLPVIWAGVKNKFFTQVLTFAEAESNPDTEKLVLRAAEGKDTEAIIGYAQPSVVLSGKTLPPGGTVERSYGYYVGPISMEKLKALGDQQEGVIDFRLFRFLVPLGKSMMWGLNRLHALTNNWGVAIILLTFVVRMLFWPLTQKGAENMKRMSELSPQMKEIKEKYKNNPQKQNAEMSAFYKANNVNPLAGCLPMVVQIPVFISLYGVLRVAVELRFAEFLWIRDLSEPEHLFFIAGFPVNILPLTMGVTMILQQKLTPSNMDEQQKKIMMIMPIVFLFISYNMPAGLLLYWTTSNLISIYQTTHTRRRDAKKAAGKPDAGKAPKSETLKPVKNPKSKKTSSGKKG